MNKITLEEALKTCAKAHNAQFCDWSDEGQYAIESETPATICDVQLICDAFFGHHNNVESEYGYTVVWLDCELLPEVDEMPLSLALPYKDVQRLAIATTIYNIIKKYDNE